VPRNTIRSLSKRLKMSSRVRPDESAR
jgi:hypothetical protein